MSLHAEGFRFVLQNGEFGWMHPNSIKPDSIDCTDMPDDEFDALVEKTQRASNTSFSSRSEEKP